VKELAYRDYITQELPQNEFLGEMVSKQLLYYPTVTREAFEHQGRVTDLLANGKIASDLGVPALNPAEDRVMICGSPEMLRDLKALCEGKGFVEGNTSTPGQFVIERGPDLKRFAKKGLAEKLGDHRPKLGSKRDAGKSVRKWRSERGLDEVDAQNFVGGMTASYQARENQPIAEDYIDERSNK
jgi:hypothetical protein